MDFDDLKRFERINVVGTSGSGKSTFACELAEVLDLPCYEMDRLFWKPDWEETPDEEFFPKVRDVTSQDRWVLDGNYTRTTPVKWQRVQVVIWLDLPFLQTVFRVTKRAFHRSLTRTEIWPGTGNRETLAKAFFSKDSIIWWAITSHRRGRARYGAAMDSPEYAHIHFLRLKSAERIASCLDALRCVAGEPHGPASAAESIAEGVSSPSAP